MLWIPEMKTRWDVRSVHLLAKLNSVVSIEFRRTLALVVCLGLAGVYTLGAIASESAKTQNSPDASTSRQLKPGPLLTLRQQLWSQLMEAQKRGVGIANYLTAFEQIEQQVESGEPDEKIKPRIVSVVRSLHQQMRAGIYHKQNPHVASASAGGGGGGGGGGSGSGSGSGSHSESGMESAMYALVNRDRSAAGLPGLASDSALAAAAKGHSLDMVKRKFYAHDNPDGEGFGVRAKKAGVKSTMVAENLDLVRSGSPDDKYLIERAERSLMNSPVHKANLLNPAFKKIGIGVAYDPNLPGIKVTQNFSD